MRPKKKIPWFQVLRLLGIGLFLYILFTIDFKAAWSVLKSSVINFILLGVLCQIILLLIKAHRWYLFRKNSDDMPIWITTSAQFFESYAIGVFTPGRVGEFMKAGHEKKKTDKISSFLKIVFERGFDLSIFFTFSGLFLFKFFSFGLLSFSILVFGISIGIDFTKRYFNFIEPGYENIKVAK